MTCTPPIAARSWSLINRTGWLGAKHQVTYLLTTERRPLAPGPTNAVRTRLLQTRRQDSVHCFTLFFFLFFFLPFFTGSQTSLSTAPRERFRWTDKPIKPTGRKWRCLYALHCVLFCSPQWAKSVLVSKGLGLILYRRSRRILWCSL